MNIKEQLTSMLKWIVTVSAPILFGAIAWSFQMERRVSAIEQHEQLVYDSIKDIKSDVHEIRSFIVVYLKSK